MVKAVSPRATVWRIGSFPPPGALAAGAGLPVLSSAVVAIAVMSTGRLPGAAVTPPATGCGAAETRLGNRSISPSRSGSVARRALLRASSSGPRPSRAAIEATVSPRRACAS
ncbi:hypothetical protein MASR1M32_26530 [Rhodobacter sp.]